MGGISVLGLRGSLPEPVEDRFWRKVDSRDDEGEELTGCWEWTGFYNSQSGQPQMKTTRATMDGIPRKSSCMAYKVAWVIANGPVPDGKAPYRMCGNKRCVRPAHLALRDHPAGKWRLFPGRFRRRVVKLTEVNAAEIRRIVESSRGRNGRADHGIYHRLGKKYGVAPQTIYDVVVGKTWPDAMGDGKRRNA